ncbi:MAG TPA: GTP cyclohydrolase I [Candidatus Eisenbacteria bacterium]|jgi:GTP cyclohydrolase I
MAGNARDADSRQAAVARAVAGLIEALGLSVAREPELAQTPARVAELYREMLSGLDPAGPLELATFPHAGQGDLVIVRDLEFHSLCVHHFVPFFGRALVAYLPGDTLVGISAAARLLEHYARRPQLQERLGQQIAEHLEQLIRPRGVAVVLEARHLCMEMRGVRKRGVVETRVVRGELADPRWADSLRLAPER